MVSLSGLAKPLSQCPTVCALGPFRPAGIYFLHVEQSQVSEFSAQPSVAVIVCGPGAVAVLSISWDVALVKLSR